MMPIIDTERQLCCSLSEAAGETVYEGLREHLFRAPGVWSFKRFTDCGALWLDPSNYPPPFRG